MVCTVSIIPQHLTICQRLQDLVFASHGISHNLIKEFMCTVLTLGHPTEMEKDVSRECGLVWADLPCGLVESTESIPYWPYEWDASLCRAACSLANTYLAGRGIFIVTCSVDRFPDVVQIAQSCGFERFGTFIVDYHGLLLQRSFLGDYHQVSYLSMA